MICVGITPVCLLGDLLDFVRTFGNMTNKFEQDSLISSSLQHWGETEKINREKNAARVVKLMIV